ncbi:hypothetical protein ncot_16045 [Nocardioides sp. JQ2195]|uniref:DUF6318 family protein n=1 Tax=Nocardioides sp. JQ2195 TaxID=2592334 RepID=UPI00143EC578|nr:DUF6318 family protein [Nocardioides sp. JQ2195]QIX27930.1 hypothetical protein ncot_16045 [Nocardioides sp. JQ2195]
MLPTRVRRVVAVACAVALAASSGCSGDDEDSSDSPSETAAGATAPGPPAAMSGTGARAAKAFITYYWAVVGHAEKTGDTTTLRDLAGDGCDACDEQATRIESVHDDGGSISGGDATVAGLQVLDHAGNATTYDVIADVEVARRTVTESKDAEPVEEPATYQTLDLTVSHDDGHWMVDQWRASSPE